MKINPGKLIGGAIKTAAKIIGGDNKESKGAKKSAGRDDSKIEDARSNAENKARGTKWSQKKKKGYEMYQRMNTGATPAKFDSLPKAERKSYVDTAKDLGHKNGAGPARALASTDGFKPSSELSSSGMDTPNLANISGGLAKAFA